MLMQIQESESYFNDFWIGMVKNASGHSVNETLKFAAS